MKIITLVALMISLVLAAVTTMQRQTVLVSQVQLDSATKLISDLRDKEQTLDLSIEFGFDPMIVQITRVLATDAIKSNWCTACPTWRFIRTEKDLTYVLLSLIQTESHGDFMAVNKTSGASGLTQLMLPTAKQYDKTVQASDLLTIPKHMKIAVIYFVDLLKKYNGNYTLAVLAWNRGPGTVDRAIAFGQSPESNYARLVFTQAALRNARQ